MKESTHAIVDHDLSASSKDRHRYSSLRVAVRYGLMLSVIPLLLLRGSALADTPKADTAKSDAAKTDMIKKHASAARAEIKTMFGFVPGFIRQVPDLAMPGAWQEMTGLEMNSASALSPKVKELIGLAVAAQMPCDYCILWHTEFARVNGATDLEIGEAVALAGETRNVSTFINGMQPDEVTFKGEVLAVVEHARKVQAGTIHPRQVDTVDAKNAPKDMEQSLGSVPSFLRQLPAAALPGFWTSMRDVEFSATNLDDKTKSLISLAVAAQIPCRYCVIADTEFAKLGGASTAEIGEAIAMAGHARNWSALLNGMQVNKASFKKDVARLVQVAKKSQQSEEAVGGKTARR